ncbi:hypothetical protein [Medusavirus stheno T3]|uniref:Uncharacterized protein n=1 Tax=Medusavirus stheno T3 TaxID=3069717 RepID=A0A7S7YEB0_9VIRU|nr:hypothetical protein QKU73_gp008 [Acanthamoeba castellanii medusavirus]QPB44189.1 hypothetical protein [Medusavirus stheno T3]
MEALHVTVVIYHEGKTRKVPLRQTSKVYLFDAVRLSVKTAGLLLAEALADLTRDEDDINYDAEVKVKYAKTFTYCPLSDNTTATACCPTTPLYALFLAAPKSESLSVPHLVVDVMANK